MEKRGDRGLWRGRRECFSGKKQTKSDLKVVEKIRAYAGGGAKTKTMSPPRTRGGGRKANIRSRYMNSVKRAKKVGKQNVCG